jgi:hypothetical protein
VELSLLKLLVKMESTTLNLNVKKLSDQLIPLMTSSTSDKMLQELEKLLFVLLEMVSGGFSERKEGEKEL